MEKDNQNHQIVSRMRNSIIFCDSMNSRELNNDDRFLRENQNRINRICRGSGRSESEFKEFIKLFGSIREMMENLKKIPKTTRDAIKSGKLNDIEPTMMSMIPKKYMRKAGAMV